MANRTMLGYDKIGPWTEIKQEIVREYAAAYSQILSAKSFHHVYIDAFAGAGLNRSRITDRLVPGSPLNALWVQPAFKEYHFVDLDKKKVRSLENIAGKRDNVHIYQGDCNKILTEEVFPKIRYDQFRRALCLLDPYGLHFNWRIVQEAGEMHSIELFINFPIADINRNVLRQDRTQILKEQASRMDSYWGDSSWYQIAYAPHPGLFGSIYEKAPNQKLVEAYRERLSTVGGFSYVPKPLAMRNKKSATMYYLFFASHKPVAQRIVDDIFQKYSRRGSYCGW